MLFLRPLIRLKPQQGFGIFVKYSFFVFITNGNIIHVFDCVAIGSIG